MCMIIIVGFSCGFGIFFLGVWDERGVGGWVIFIGLCVYRESILI